MDRAKEAEDKQVLEEFMQQLQLKARDHGRIPMQVCPPFPSHLLPPRSD